MTHVTHKELTELKLALSVSGSYGNDVFKPALWPWRLPASAPLHPELGWWWINSVETQQGASAGLEVPVVSVIRKANTLRKSRLKMSTYFSAEKFVNKHTFLVQTSQFLSMFSVKEDCCSPEAHDATTTKRTRRVTVTKYRLKR